AAQSVHYVNAGTVEFLLDPATGQFYFLEMNTRIQVEHPVTEWVTGIDIVKEQIRIAAGEPLGFRQEDVPLRGWAIECRINAEDPDRRWLPSPGTLTAFDPPSGPWVRVDSGVAAGHTVQPFYDSLVAKLTAWGRDRDEAIARLRRALAEFRVEGIKTTIGFHQTLLDHPDFRAGRYDTRFLETVLLAQPGMAPAP
ncbi:MAG: acetyl-CoA carboxylase biotin carboxylase subunit, partial [Clostridia bacterium]|nr:acetyl-CoA carboxylase biotin carboxylase subunit [Clostridia bacterium]